MGKKDTEIKIDPPLSQNQMEEQSLFDLENESLDAQAKEAFKDKPKFISALKKIAYYTAKVGLPLNEACTLVNIDFKKFEEEMKMEPLIKKIIMMKELEYKKDLLYTISQKAKSGDDKLAQWLLERRYPDEYGSKKNNAGEGTGNDIMFEAIRFIQKNGGSDTMVQESSGRAMVVKRKSVTMGVHERIGDILSGIVPAEATEEDNG